MNHGKPGALSHLGNGEVELALALESAPTQISGDVDAPCGVPHRRLLPPGSGVQASSQGGSGQVARVMMTLSAPVSAALVNTS